VPKRPGASQHLPCAGCHAQQFANNESPICTICHTDAKTGALKPFPHLKSFRMKFDHALHVSMGSVSCATCHRESRAGVAMSIPSGFNAHATCWRCHTPRAQSGGKDISSCGTCHQLGGYNRTTQSEYSFKAIFTHGDHRGVGCGECHSVRSGAPNSQQVTNIAILEHRTSPGNNCLQCHNGRRAFTGNNPLDVNSCTKCHKGMSNVPLPPGTKDLPPPVT
jgi:c(7)-type cytochrome triheme protein